MERWAAIVLAFVIGVIALYLIVGASLGPLEGDKLAGVGLLLTSVAMLVGSWSYYTATRKV